MPKVWMYIDGPNFYYGLRKQTRLPIGLGWCDFRKLAETHLLGSNSALDCIKYFTFPVGDFAHRDGEEHRQNTWLNAVRTIKGVKVISGYYSGKDAGGREEKQTDVNIAVQLILDAISDDGYDEALLLSGDTDLAPAVLAVRNELPSRKPIHVWVPLHEPSERWKEIARIHDIALGEVTGEMLQGSSLPDRIPARGGAIICPERWKLPTV